MVLRIGFWNTRGKKPELHPAAAEVVRDLLAGYEIDILALVEVVEDSVPVGLPAPWASKDITEKAGRGRWDAAIVWNGETIELESARPVVTVEGEYHLRIAVEVEARVRHLDRAPLRVLVSHWPMPTGGAIGHAKYYRGLQGLVDTDRDRRPTILVGDYNRDPFDTAAETLSATRDRHLASRRPNLLYNLSWRWLGTWGQTGAAGTYFYENPETHWRTYDQVLVSSHFLRNGAPMLLKDSEVMESIGGRSIVERGFDHLPIVTTFETAIARAGEEAR